MKKLLLYLKKIALTIAIPSILFLVCYSIFPERINLSVLRVLLIQAVTPAILAWGVCFSIKLRIFDFSVGSVVLISGIVGANLANMLGLGIIGIVILCPLFGLLGGMLTGTVFVTLKIPSIIVSIGMMLIYESFSGLLFKGKGVLVSGDVFTLASFPTNVIIGLTAFCIAYYMFNFTPFGYHVRAVGNGIAIAKLHGINVDKVRVMCFGITGFFAGIFAFMQLGGAGVMKAQSNMTTMGVVVDAIICACIALALERVCNLIIGVFIGSITTQIIKVAILVSGFPSMYQQVVIAVFLLIFMGISSRSDVLQKAAYKIKRKNLKVI